MQEVGRANQEPVVLDQHVGAGLAQFGREVAQPVALLGRMKPTPVILVGVTAWVATTASVGTRSDMSDMSTSTPRRGCRGGA